MSAQCFPADFSRLNLTQTIEIHPISRNGHHVPPAGTHITYGVNHFKFDGSSVALLKQLDPAQQIPARVEFNWQSIEPAAGLVDYTISDQMVSIIRTLRRQ